MPAWNELLRFFYSGLEQLREAVRRIDKLEEGYDELDERVRALEVDMARLKGDIRGEVANAIADLRIRYAEANKTTERALPKPKRMKR